MIPSALLPLLLLNASPEANLPEPLIKEDGPEVVNDGSWNGSVTAGAIVTTGNSETETASISADAGWKTDEHALQLNFLWNYQSTTTANVSTITQRKLFGMAQYDHFLSNSTYAYGNATGEHDFTANLDLRTTTGLGIGRDFRDDEHWAVSGEAGVSYVDENYIEQAGVASIDGGFVAARVAYKTAFKGNEKWGFSHEGQVFPSLEDSNDVNARWDTRFNTNLTDTMFAQIQWVLTYDNTPVSGADRQDHLFALTIGWTF